MQTQPLQFFNADIRAARLAKIPVELSTRGLLQSIETPTRLQLQSLTDKQPNANAIQSRHQAAIDIHTQLGSMVPVLDGLSARAIASRQFSQMFRRVLWYLALMLLVALLGLFCFKYFVVPKYEALRNDMLMHHNVTDYHGNTFPYVIPMIVVVAVLLCLTLFFLLTNRTGWLLSLFGGQTYVRLKVSSGAARTLALLASQNAAMEEATHTTATLYALDTVGREQLSGSGGESSSVETWQNLDKFWSVRASKKIERARTLAPTVVLLTIGGAIALAYAVIIYWPLIGLLRDLIEVGLRS